MSFSQRDLEEAFNCALEEAVEAAAVPPRILQHLTGECKCDRNRCPKCKCRPRNGIPRHKPGCANGPKKI